MLCDVCRRLNYSGNVLELDGNLTTYVTQPVSKRQGHVLEHNIAPTPICSPKFEHPTTNIHNILFDERSFKIL